MSTEPNPATGEHECVYSRSLNQPYPRHCIKCGKVEPTQPKPATGEWKTPQQIAEDIHKEMHQQRFLHAFTSQKDIIDLVLNVIDPPDSDEVVGVSQPKPATGEWTAAYVFSLVSSQAIADAHNAALASR
jgi:hypothetical protein